MYQKVQITIHRLKILLLAAAILASQALSSAQDYEFHRYGRKEGLPPTTIEDICRSDDGFVWLATWAGIYRFDGSEFVRFSPEEDARSIRFTRIDADNSGTVWALGHDGSLYSVGQGSGSMERHTPGLSYDGMFRISDGSMMFAASDGAVLSSTPRGSSPGNGKLYIYLPAGEQPGKVNDIFRDTNGMIYMLCDNGIVRDRELIGTDPAFCHLRLGDVLCIGSTAGRIIVIDERGEREVRHTGTGMDIRIMSNIPSGYSLLIGSAAAGLYMFSPDTGAVPVETPFAGEEFRTAKGADGELWLYSRSGGLGRFDRTSGNFVSFYNEGAQGDWGPENRLSAFLCDYQDILWIAGSLRGLERACRNDTLFHVLPMQRDPEPSTRNSVISVYRSGGGLNYIGTKDGRVHIYDEMMSARIARWTLSSGVHSFEEGDDGTIWMGTDGDGLAVNTASYYSFPLFRPSYYRNTPEFYDSDANHISCLLRAGDGRLWIGSSDGPLSYLEDDDGRRRFISRKNRLSYPADMVGEIHHLCFGPGGTALYASGVRGILMCPNPQDDPEEMEFKWFGNVRGTDIRHLLFASDGSLYASSYGDGFLRLDPDDRNAPFTQYTTGDGLVSNYVLASVEDAKGNLWIISNVGLSRLDPESGSITGYHAEMIRPNLLLNGGEPMTDMDGTVYIGTNSGVLYFNPGQIADNTYSPKLIVLEADISGEQTGLRTDEAVRIGGRDRLNLRLKAIDMKAPERVTYSYSLTRRAQEERWQFLGNDGRLSLDGLKAGRYTLRLRSTNSDGYPAHNDLVFTIKAGPRHIWPALAALACLAGVLSALLLRRRKGSGSSAGAAQADSFTLKLQALSDANLDNPDFSLDDICREMGMSRNTLYGRCRERLGTTPSAYLLQRRLDKARELLENREYSISQTAYMTGFNDPHYFSKAFKRHFGETPSEFRRKIAIFGSNR